MLRSVRSEPLHAFNDHHWQSSTSDFSSCSHYLATGGWDKCINVYNVDEVRRMFRLDGAHTLPVTCVRWLDRQLLSTSADRTAVLWDATTGLRKQQFVGHTGWLMHCCVGSAGVIATAGWDNNVGIWDPHRPSPVRMMSGHVAGVWSVAEMPRSQGVIASASEDCTMRLWDSRTGSSIATLAGGHNDSILTVCWPDREFVLASGSSDCSIMLWDTRTCKALARVESHTDSVRELCGVNTVPGYLASVGDESIKIWDMREGQVTLAGSRTFPADIESISVSGLTHACSAVNGKLYLSMFVGLDEKIQDSLREKYTSTIASLEPEEEKHFTFRGSLHPSSPTPQQEYLPPYSDEMEEDHSFSSSSPISMNSSPLTGCKLERSGSDSGVETSTSTFDVT